MVGVRNYTHKTYLRPTLRLVCTIKRTYHNPDMIPVQMWDSSKFVWSYTIGQVWSDKLKRTWTKMEVQILDTNNKIRPDSDGS